MTRGRKRKPTNLILLEGNPGRRKVPKTPEPPEGEIEAPSHLDTYGLEEWNRIISGLRAMKIVAPLDKSALAAYCSAYSRWRNAEEELNKLKETNSLNALILKTVSGNYIQQPLIGIANKAANDMVRYAAEFGLTPAARAKLGVTPQKEKSKFEGLINGKKA